MPELATAARTIAELFEAQALSTPEAPAVTSAGQTLSYAELDARANQLAHELRARGVGPEVGVGLCAERSLAMMVGLLGILKAGGAYVPLDPRYPAGRLSYMVTDTAVPLVLTHDGLAGDWVGTVPVGDIDELSLETGFEPPPAVAPAVALDPDNLAYVMYTSGSTGNPKGVCVPHRGVVNRLAWGQRTWPLGVGDSVLQKTPFTFDVSVWELFWPLMCGARLVLAGPEGHRDPAYLVSLINSEQVNIVHFVPSMLAQFLTEPTVRRLRTVRHVMCSGEALPADLANRAQELIGAPIHNLYGPTEASIEVSLHTWRPDPTASSVPIGTEIDNVSLHVLDAEWRRVPTGQEGELYIGGAAVTRCYRHHPAMTAERFLPDPFTNGQRMYRTGDLVVRLENGEIEYRGRVDQQVKIHGRRIELGEISSVLRQHDGIADAVTVAQSDGEVTRLVAYYVNRPGRTPTDPETLRKHLAHLLPDYMIPTAFVALDELPLTPSGKVDRAALKPPQLTREVAGGVYAAPTTDVEAILVRAWCAALGAPEIGVDDDFFALGGDSIAALRIGVRCREAGLQVTPGQIFHARTVRELAPIATPLDGDPDAEFAYDARRDAALTGLLSRPEIADAYPLTPMQAGMLFHSDFSGDSSEYHQQVVLELDGIGDPETLALALQDLVDANPALRTRVHVDGVPAPVQVVLRHFSLPVERLDWRGLSNEDQERHLAGLLAKDRAHRFQPTVQPPIRAALIRRAAERTDVVLSHHHLLLDGWSLELLAGQLVTAVGCRAKGERPRLAHAAPYHRYVNWLVAQDSLAAHDFWRGYLAGVTEPTRLELFEPGGDSGDGTVADVSFDITGELLRAMRDVARSTGLTLGTLAHGFWALLLARYCGREEVLFGSTVAGRPADLWGVEDMVGLFINSIAVRASLTPSATFSSWLLDLQDNLLRVRDYGHSSLAEVHACTELAKGTQIFDTIVITQNLPAQQPDVAGIDVRVREVPDHTGYPLLIIVDETRERIRFSLRHQRSRLGEATVRRIAGHLRTLCRTFAEDPGRLLADVRVLTPGEQEEVVTGFNADLLGGIDAAFTGEETIHGLFERQAARTPFAVAATDGDKSLTYRELNARANRLARYLRERGVGREDLVAVALNRSLDLVVTLLAVMKAGAAYVPLAADNPPERLKVMIEDARPACFLVQQRLAHLVTGSNVYVLEREAARIAAHDGSDLNLAAHPDQLAYVIYTSGSSGQPKGVACPHRGLVNYLGFCAKRYASRGDGGAPLFSSVGFDMIVPNLYTPLLLGQAVHLLPDDLELESLAEHLLEHAPLSFIKMTPGHLELLTQQLDPHDAARLAGVLAVGADSFPAHVLDNWRQLAPGTDILNEYGPTEASVANAIYTPVGPVDTELVPIGRAIPNTTMYLLDGQLNPVPQGVAGEIFIGGVCPARGYLNLPDRTAQAFLPDEFAGTPGARMYRTGDRGYWRADGNLQFLRRLDDQVKINGYRVETGEVEHVLNAHPAVDYAIAVARPNAHGRNQLVAYLLAGSTGLPAASQLRAWLAERLPPYLIPTVFVPIDTVPLDANGKVNRRALPAPAREARAQDTPAAARNDVERRLVEVLAEVLEVEQVGIHDNYFELGGDSMLSIQVVAAARRAGLAITPKDIFEHPSVAGLAPHAQPVASAPSSAELADEAGHDVPLTAIQTWFLRSGLRHPQHYNQSVLLETAVSDPWLLEDALNAVIERHPALRGRFTESGGQWRQHFVERETAALLAVHRLPAGEAGEAEMLSHANDLHASLDLRSGPIVRAGLFLAADQGPARLLIVAHHLAIDTVSWRFILDDLARACAGLDLPAPTITPAAWAKAQHRRIFEPEVLAQRDYWLNAGAARTPLPFERDLGPDVVGTAQTVRVALPEPQTDALLSKAPAAYRVRVEEILLTAFALTLDGWAGGPVPIDVERHGREHPLNGVDASRGVGWFTSVVPLTVQVGQFDHRPGDALRHVKEHLRTMPANGYDHMLLSHLSRDYGVRQADAQVIFNYHGRLDRSLPGAGDLRLIAPSFGLERDPEQQRTHAIEVEAMVVADRLVVDLTYPGSRLSEQAMRDLGERFLEWVRTLADHCVRNPGGYTPSDFPLARLSEVELTAMTGGHGDIEDIFPLTPTQAGMLFHTLMRPDENIYIDQQVFTLEGPANPELLARAWAEAAQRHAVMRSTIDWRNAAQPMQVVWRAPQLAITVGAAEAARERRRFHDDELAWRVRIAAYPETVQIIFTYHHLLLDAWSVSLLLSDVMACYEALLEQRVPQLPAAGSFRRYVQWLETADTSAAAEHWAGLLGDVTTPTPLPEAVPPQRGTGGGYARANLTPEQTVALRRFARKRQLTLGTLAHAAWALVLGATVDSRDVLFGCTVAGRQAGLPQAESIVGLMINTLPVRLRLEEDAPLEAWCRQLLRQLVRLREFEHTPLVDVQAHSRIPRGTPLFSSIVVVENSMPPVNAPRHGRLTLADATESTGYPIVVNIREGETLCVEVLYERHQCHPETASILADLLGDALVRLSADEPQSVGELFTRLSAQFKERIHDLTHRVPLRGGVR